MMASFLPDYLSKGGTKQNRSPPSFPSITTAPLLCVVCVLGGHFYKCSSQKARQPSPKDQENKLYRQEIDGVDRRCCGGHTHPSYTACLLDLGCIIRVKTIVVICIQYVMGTASVSCHTYIREGGILTTYFQSSDD